VAEDVVVPSAGGSLTLAAGRSVIVDADIVTAGGDLTIIANDVLASGVVDAHREPGEAEILVADDAVIDTGSGDLTVELRDGAGKTHTDAGTLELKRVTAAGVTALATDARIELGDVDAASILAVGDGSMVVIADVLAAAGTGDAITLATDVQLVNTAGASALDAPSGRFLLYVPTPSSVTPDGLTFAFEEHDKTYPDPPEPEHTGSGILYASLPIPTGGPQVTVEQADGQPDPTSDDTIAFEIVFSEDVVGFTPGGVDLSLSDAGDALEADITGGPRVFELLVSGMAEDGMVIARIPAGAAAAASDGTPNEASTSDDNTVEWLAPSGGGGAGGMAPSGTGDLDTGGGCTCSTPGAPNRIPWPAAWLLFTLAAPLATRRRGR
jgi:MYXO-CTERM domain-containing protein